MVKCNPGRVEEMMGIAGELGIEPATPDEIRQWLVLKDLRRVSFQQWLGVVSLRFPLPVSIYP
jgi:hypothetical protein